MFRVIHRIIVELSLTSRTW